MLFLIAHIAIAADSTRCVARWSGPTPGCAVPEELTIAGSGINGAEAEREARSRLARLMERTSDAIRGHVTDRYSTEFRLCDEHANTEATVTCFPDFTPEDPGVCFITFDDPDCWDGDVLVASDIGWRALDRGRREMCAQVDERLARLNYSNVDELRAVCRASCAVGASVRCPTLE